MSETKKPKVSNSFAEQELDKAQKQFDAYDENVKSLTKDCMDMAPKEDIEPQTKMSQQDISRSKDIYLKPEKSISSRERFNEKWRSEYEYQKEYVHFTAEHKEIMGEPIELWTKPFPGVSAEYWKVPVNKPVWGPRHLAEQIKRKFYHRLIMQQTQTTGSDGYGQYYGGMAVDKTVQRLDAIPVSNRKSIFMGASGFK